LAINAVTHDTNHTPMELRQPNAPVCNWILSP
jgi:hypothetical protein